MEVGHGRTRSLRNLINPACDRQFSSFYAEYGGLKFMLAPNNKDSPNDYLAQVLERVCLCTLRYDSSRLDRYQSCLIRQRFSTFLAVPTAGHSEA